MPQIDNLRTHLIDELRDTLDAENQLVKALPKMARAASTPRLKQAFTSHLAQTRKQAERVKQALQALGERASSKTCDGMKGLLEEGEEMMSEAPAGPVRDAVLIASAQKVEHYEIASYGTAATYAKLLGEPQVLRLLVQTLNEEKAADEKLTAIAEASVNERAAAAWAESQSEADDEGMVAKGAEWLGGAAKSTARSLGLSSPTRRTNSRGRGARARKRAKRSRKK